MPAEPAARGVRPTARRLLLAAALAAALGGGVQAAEPAAGPAPVPATNAETDRSLKALVEWREQLRDAAVAMGVSLREVLQGATTAQEFRHNQDLAGGAQWAARWLPGQRGQLAAIMAQIQRLPPAPPWAPAETDSPEIKKMMATYRQYGEAVAKDMKDAGALQTELLDLIEKAVAGDDAALSRLKIRMWDGTIEASRAELATLEIGAAATPPDHPQTDVTATFVAIEKALIEVFKVRRNITAGDPTGAQAAAGEIRALADSADLAARRMDADAAKALGEVRSGARSTELRRRLGRAFATYRDSSRTARQLAAVMRDLANGLVSERSLDSAQASKALKSLIEKTRELQALDQTRGRIIAGQQ